MCLSEGGGLRAPAAPPGKSFRFVRACERAGGRAREIKSILFTWLHLSDDRLVLAGRCFLQIDSIYLAAFV